MNMLTMIATSRNMNCLRMLRLVSRPTITNNANSFMLSAARYATQHPLKFMETQDRWRERDGVSRRWQLIYKAPMEQWLKYLSVYLTFSTTSVAAGGLYYGIFQFNTATMNEPVIMGNDIVLANSSVECLVYLGAFVAFHLAVKIVLSKYVYRIYQDGDKYLAIFKGNIGNSITKHEFQLDEFKKLKPRLALSWTDARFSLGKKHAIILENYFKTPEYFNYMLNKNSKDNPNKDD